jgi:hypothetical protein
MIGKRPSRDELIGKNIVVYDMEIKNVIDGMVVDPSTGQQKKLTWNDHHLMGMSCGVLWDYETMEFSITWTTTTRNLVRG